MTVFSKLLFASFVTSLSLSFPIFADDGEAGNFGKTGAVGKNGDDGSIITLN